MGADALSDVLRAVRLTGAVFFNLDVKAPWVAETPTAIDCAPYVMPHAGYLIEYHLLTRGSCWAGLIDAEPVQLQAGDIIVFPRGDAHVLSSKPGMRFTPDMTNFEGADKTQLPFQLQFGGEGPEEAGVVCGFLGCDARPFNPLLAALPRLLHLPASSPHRSAWLNHIVQAAVDESVNKRSGGESVLGRLSELMFIEVVRSYIQTLSAEETGWLAALADKHIAAALNAMHGKPSQAWTLEDLAKIAGLSRSAFAERFAQVLGRPPIQYLAEWRMQLATSLLVDSKDAIAQVAAKVGYESEAAFSRAFKKLVGAPPAEWRRAHAARKGSAAIKSGDEAGFSL
jgi:AraC-like DNA-binding protein